MQDVNNWKLHLHKKTTVYLLYTQKHFQAIVQISFSIFSSCHFNIQLLDLVHIRD